ncbi:hypothetical protein [Ruficoccus sp. ZRK36]|uniref:hypothetical protein n=1 Tax=Ruficoccus sp. ZRK36 TaxID=2866311 RepID=UPI001C73C8B9|nr:hypothetical protein [Ruficoccus sp. ZRK36]QYY37276.1 hypothetical protein K0V07_07275 [Ruficoccus sp. ZRK36]
MLTYDQNKDAVAAISLLQKSGTEKSLIFAVNYLLEHYQEAAEAKSVEDAILDYREEKEREVDRGILSSRQFGSIFDELATFKIVFEGQIIREIQPEELKEYLEGKQKGTRRAHSLKTWNNRRGYLSTFFKFCLSRKYVAEDPVISVPKFKIKNRRGTAETFSAKQTQKLMHWLETYRGKQNKGGSWWAEPGSLVPYFALTFSLLHRPFHTKTARSSFLPTWLYWASHACVAKAVLPGYTGIIKLCLSIPPKPPLPHGPSRQMLPGGCPSCMR